MLNISIPRFGDLRLEHLVLDVNGTLTRDGVLLPGLTERLERLHPLLEIELISADTLGRLEAIATQLGLPFTPLTPGEAETEQKAVFVRNLGVRNVVAIGNGANDVGMLKEAALAIAVIGTEGLAVEALLAADLVVNSIDDALDLLLAPTRIIASLRR
jgi:P-type E1-E2 ATPase